MNTFGWVALGMFIIAIVGIGAAAYVATHIDLKDAANAVQAASANAPAPGAFAAVVPSVAPAAGDVSAVAPAAGDLSLADAAVAL